MKRKIIQNNKNNKKNITDKKSYSKNNHLVKKEILEIGITDASKEEILEYILDSLKNSSKKYYIVTPNPEMIVFAQSHKEVASFLNGAELALCDGVGLLWAAHLLGIPLAERFTGVQLMEKLCEKANNQLITIGFFGGKPGVAELAAECLKQKYPNMKVVSASSEWNNPQRHTTPIDILFVALGFPKQEQWMTEHLSKENIRVMVGVGGAFDYLSGKVPRAPEWLQSVGLEWLFRLSVQPWRWKRQLALPKFVWLVLKEKLAIYHL